MIQLLFNIYFGINIFLLGGYFLDSFNTDSLKTKSSVFFILFFFGGILVLWEAFFAQRFANSNLMFWWKMYVNKKYDNLKPEQVEYIEGQILREKELNRKESQKLINHLTRILKRHNKQVQKKYTTK